MNIAKSTILLGLLGLLGFTLALTGCGAKTQAELQTNANVESTKQEPTYSYKDFQWIGLESKINNVLDVKPNVDKTSWTTSYKPDGILDGHFRITLVLNEPLAISNIYLTNSEFGRDVKWTWYPGYAPGIVNYGKIMAIYDNGELISGMQGYKISGRHTLDIYAKGFKEFSFDKEKEFTLEIVCATKESKYADKGFTAKIKI